MLPGLSWRQAEALGSFHYVPTKVLVHMDRSFLPGTRRAGHLPLPGRRRG